MSGSPILDDHGRAIGVVSAIRTVTGEAGGGPRLDWQLPVGLLAVMTGKGGKAGRRPCRTWSPPCHPSISKLMKTA